jgi:hypothetical protein
LHGGHAGLLLARQVRGDAQHALQNHELRPMMHLVLFGAQQHLEAGFGGRLGSGGEAYLLGQEFVG